MQTTHDKPTPPVRWMKFDNLKIGDIVFFQYGGFASQQIKPRKVTKVTKTTFSIEGTTSRFRMDGREISSDRWGANQVIPYTDDNVKRFEIQERRAELMNLHARISERNQFTYLSEDKIDLAIELMKQLNVLVKKTSEVVGGGDT